MIIYLNADNNPVTYNKKQYLLAAAKRLGLDVFQELTNSISPDYVLNIQPFSFRSGFKWTGLWHIDVLLDSDIPENWYNQVDTLFVASNQGKIHHPAEQLLFQAADPFLHKRIEAIPQEFDYVLCGTMQGEYYEERSRLHGVLQDQFTFKDYGKEFPIEKYVENINRAKVQWVHPAMKKPEFIGMAAQRFFECLAIGPVLAYRSLDLPLTGLVEDEDFMAYSTATELMDKMEKLIKNRELRNRIAANGRKKALLYHSYEQRLMAIYNAVVEIA